MNGRLHEVCKRAMGRRSRYGVCRALLKALPAVKIVCAVGHHFERDKPRRLRSPAGPGGRSTGWRHVNRRGAGGSAVYHTLAICRDTIGRLGPDAVAGLRIGEDHDAGVAACRGVDRPFPGRPAACRPAHPSGSGVSRRHAPRLPAFIRLPSCRDESERGTHHGAAARRATGLSRRCVPGRLTRRFGTGSTGRAGSTDA